MSPIQPRRVRPARTFLCATLLVAMPIGTACTEGTTSPPPATGLEILVLRGPIEPVEREGEVNSAPVAAAMTVVRRADGRRVAELTTDSNGEARVALEPGRYTIEVERCPGALFLPGPATATVQVGEFTDVQLECDTGIR